MRLPIFKKPPPENAHGQRNIDDSYFSVWICQNGHGEIGGTDDPPDRGCMKCMFEGFTDGPIRNLPELGDTAWRIGTRQEARDFIFEIEGFRMYDGVGFKVL